jgi:carbamoyltransferase
MTPIIGMYGIQDRQDGPHPLETHDHALCRVEGGRVVRHLALERWTRRKHDNRMQEHIEALAADGFLTRGENAILACADSFVGRSFISRGGRWRVEAPPSDGLAIGPVPARAHVLGRELAAWVVPHELAHLGSSLPFIGGWEDNTLLIHVDGAASHSCCSAWLWKDSALHLLHHGWELADAVAGYATNNLAQALVGHDWRTFLAVPGKLMGLAAWGTPDPEVRAWLDRHEWFSRLRGGSARFEQAARDAFGWRGQLVPDDQLVQTLAACFQERFELAVFGYVERFAALSGARRLILAGGGGLNLPSNQRIADSGIFEHVFVPPCAGDDGLALGAASLVAWLGGQVFERHSAFLNDVGAPALGRSTEADLAMLADAIARGEVVGTCLGTAEVGPRALGHRSLLARPKAEDAHHVSVVLKGRETWRPVAPLVLAELADDLFVGTPSRSPLAPHMLGRFRASEWALRDAPGVVHVDGTARVQIVGDETELRPIRMLLQALWARHRIPCVLNTSFNRKGEPIVQTLDQAREVASEMGIDHLWHGGRIEGTQRELPGVGFTEVAELLVTWRSDAVHAAVESGLLSLLPLTDGQLVDVQRRLLAALGEMGLVEKVANRWSTTVRGALLRDDHPSSLAPVARYWAGDGRAPWHSLVRALHDSAWRPTDPFAEQAHDPARVQAYHAAMRVYALRDYAGVPHALDPDHRLVIDAGGGHGALAEAVLRVHGMTEAMVLDRPEVVAQAIVPADLRGRLRHVGFDLFATWPTRADAIVLARVLHDWNDTQAKTILEQARAALEPGGRLYVVERLRQPGGHDGALLDLHMLLSTGGRERTRQEFKRLLNESGFELRDVRCLVSAQSVLVSVAR